MRTAGLIALLMGVSAGCGDPEPETPAVTKAPARASLASASRPARDTDKGTRPATTTAPARRGEALGFLPRDALVALRFPELNGHEKAWSDTAVRQAMSRLHLEAFEELYATLRDDLRAKLAATFPPANEAWDLFGRVRGELVVSLVRVFPATILMNSQEFPAAVVAHLKIGREEASMRKILDEVAAHPEVEGQFQKTAEGRYVWTTPETSLEVRLGDGWLHASLGPASGMADGLEQWMALAPEDSMLATEVVRSAAQPEAASEAAFFEAFANLEPVWPMVKAFAPPEAQKFVDSTRVDHIAGFSMVSCIEGALFRDYLTMHSPGGEDVLSRMLTAPPLDPAFSRFVFRDADTAGVMSLDLAQVYRSIRSALPAAEQSKMDEGVQGIQAMMGIDLNRDLLTNLGPHFVMATRGDLVSATMEGGDYEAVLVFQMRDAKATQGLIDRFLQGSGMMNARKVYKVLGVNCYSVPLPVPDAPPWLEFCYAFVDDALVFSTSPDVFEKSLKAMQEGGENNSLQRAMASLEDGARGVSIQSTASQLKSMYNVIPGVQAALEAASTASGSGVELGANAFPALEEVLKQMRTAPEGSQVWRQMPEGVRLESRNAIPSAWIAGAPLAIVASVAIPNLLSARLGANESAAIANLRGIAAAQEQFRGVGVADRDGDGRGEYGFLGELAGTSPLPKGIPLNPPMLSPAWGAVQDGVVHRSGYVYRVYVAAPGGLPVAERAEGGAPMSLAADGAEQGYAVYAWPEEFGMTGGRVFVLDAEGNVFATTNDGPGQGYSGMLHMPAADASFVEPGNILGVGRRSVRRGQDGALWMQVE